MKINKKTKKHHQNNYLTFTFHYNRQIKHVNNNNNKCYIIDHLDNQYYAFVYFNQKQFTAPCPAKKKKTNLYPYNSNTTLKAHLEVLKRFIHP